MTGTERTLSLFSSYHVSEEVVGEMYSLSLGKDHTKEVAGCGTIYLLKRISIKYQKK